MSYIVMDLEWNQAMSAQSSVFNKLPIHLRGEIIQIGAIKLTEDFLPGEEFQIDVKPVYFRRMHYKVEKLTGFDKARLSGGVGFVEAFTKFREWCGGDDCTFLTWGNDDKGIMEQNIIIHDLDWDWIDKWVNLQIIYNLQTNAGRNQTGLLTAMEHFDIEQTRVAHDALGDAYNTALVCSHLNLIEGIIDYESASKILSIPARTEKDENDKSPKAFEHRAFTGYATRGDAFSDKGISEPLCPICEMQLKGSRWINQGDRRYMSLCTCKSHGSFLVRIKFREAQDDTLTVNRIIYKADSEMEAFYKSKAHSGSRRHSRGKKKKLPSQSSAKTI